MLIATPNLCLDRTEWVTEMVPGGVMRARSVEVTAGGKGVNVARVLRSFGRTATLIGFAPDGGKDTLLGLLDEEGAQVIGVEAAGNVRTAIVIHEEQVQRTTVLNEPGPVISPATWARYRETVAKQLVGEDILVCIGSLPPGVPPGGYGELVEVAHAAGALAIVDSAPAALRAALSSGPDLVTPNLEEAEATIAGAAGDLLVSAGEAVPQRARAAARALCELGALRAAVTAGAFGVALADAGDVTWIPTVETEVVSAVGAGDSFVAGLTLALTAGETDWAAAAVRGVATATASCEQFRAGGVDPARVAELLSRITASRGAA